MVNHKTKLIKMCILLVCFLVGSDISMPILELESNYEQRYSSALNSILGPENFHVEIHAVIDKKVQAPELPTEIPIKFLPGLGISIKSIPEEIISDKSSEPESVKSVDVILTLDENLSDSLVSVATLTIKNHILFSKIPNNLTVNRATLYKSPDTIINIDAPDISAQESMAKNSVIGGVIIGFIILLGFIVLIWFINKIYNRFSDFTQSQLEGQDAVRLTLEEKLTGGELALEGALEDVEEIVPEPEEAAPVVEIPIADATPPIVSEKSDGSLEAVFREVGGDIIEAIANIAEPVTTSVKEAISESTDLELYQKNPFDFLSVLNGDLAAKVLNDENPGSSAIALSYLDPKTAASILSNLDIDARLKIAQHMATMEGTSKEILQTVRKQFRDKVMELLKPDFTPLDGVNVLTNILNQMNQEDSESIIFSIGQTNKTISENIRSRIGYFSDVLTMEDEDIDKLLNEVDTNTLSYALVDCDEAISQKLLKSLSDSGKNALKRKITLLEGGDPRMIEESRKKIGEFILRITSSE